MIETAKCKIICFIPQKNGTWFIPTLMYVQLRSLSGITISNLIACERTANNLLVHRGSWVPVHSVSLSSNTEGAIAPVSLRMAFPSPPDYRLPLHRNGTESVVVYLINVLENGSGSTVVLFCVACLFCVLAQVCRPNSISRPRVVNVLKQHINHSIHHLCTFIAVRGRIYLP